MDIEKAQMPLGIVFALLLAGAAFFLAKRAGFFSLPSPFISQSIRIKHVLWIFFIYFSLSFIILPFASIILLALSHGGIKEAVIFAKNNSNLLQLPIFLGLFLSLFLYCLFIDRKIIRDIFWGDLPASSQRFWKGVGMGVVSLAVSYPFVFLVSTVLDAISTSIWGKEKYEQMAVKQLKLTLDDPFLFTAMFFIVVVLAPIMEELLFRGFLQTFLKKHLKRTWAILITAILFSIVHYVPSQNIGNFELIGSLFVLALFLGFIYEREKTLWAPIGLHIAFNGSSVLMIYLTKTS